MGVTWDSAGGTPTQRDQSDEPKDHRQAGRIPQCGVGSAMGAMGALGKENAPTSKRMPPSTINTRPGQFSFSPNPAPGLRGSRVSRGTAEDLRRLASLSRPRQMGCASMNSSPPRTNSAPSQMTSILASYWYGLPPTKV